jgi:hypothetical protein
VRDENAKPENAKPENAKPENPKLEDFTLENMELVEIAPEVSKLEVAPSKTAKLEKLAPSRTKFQARVVRTLRSMFALFARPDDAWAKSVLRSAEFSVYKRMDPRDREHGVRVARALLERHPEASNLVVQAALLHDCGKLVRRYSLPERVWVGWRVPEPGPDVRLSSAQLGAITSPRPTRVGARRVQSPRAEPPSAADVRRFHPQIGAWLIRAAGGSERVALIVERHHFPGNDPEILWVHEVDELE